MNDFSIIGQFYDCELNKHNQYILFLLIYNHNICHIIISKDIYSYLSQKIRKNTTIKVIGHIDLRKNLIADKIISILEK